MAPASWFEVNPVTQSTSIATSLLTALRNLQKFVTGNNLQYQLQTTTPVSVITDLKYNLRI